MMDVEAFVVLVTATVIAQMMDIVANSQVLLETLLVECSLVSVYWYFLVLVITSIKREVVVDIKD